MNEAEHRSRKIAWLRDELAQMKTNPHNLRPAVQANVIARAEEYLAEFIRETGAAVKAEDEDGAEG